MRIVLDDQQHVSPGWMIVAVVGDSSSRTGRWAPDWLGARRALGVGLARATVAGPRSAAADTA
jgi:hypothetical protein